MKSYRFAVRTNTIKYIKELKNKKELYEDELIRIMSRPYSDPFLKQEKIDIINGKIKEVIEKIKCLSFKIEKINGGGINEETKNKNRNIGSRKNKRIVGSN